MSPKPTSSRSIVLAMLAASALALGGCAETTSGAGYAGYGAPTPIAGAHVSSATAPSFVSTTTPQANPPLVHSPFVKPSSVKLARINDAR